MSFPHAELLHDFRELIAHKICNMGCFSITLTCQKIQPVSTSFRLHKIQLDRFLKQKWIEMTYKVILNMLKNLKLQLNVSV